MHSTSIIVIGCSTTSTFSTSRSTLNCRKTQSALMLNAKRRRVHTHVLGIQIVKGFGGRLIGGLGVALDRVPGLIDEANQAVVEKVKNQLTSNGFTIISNDTALYIIIGVSAASFATALAISWFTTSPDTSTLIRSCLDNTAPNSGSELLTRLSESGIPHAERGLIYYVIQNSNSILFWCNVGKIFFACLTVYALWRVTVYFIVRSNQSTLSSSDSRIRNNPY